jgi:hypothetical protein
MSGRLSNLKGFFMPDSLKSFLTMLGVVSVFVIIVIFAKAAPFVPAVGTDMACPSPYPAVLGTTDGTTMSCFVMPTPAAPVIGAPTSRTLSLATAYQATTSAKPAVVTINLTSTAAISLSGGATNTADIVIGSTNGVASGTGTVICKHANSNTGTLTVGLNLSTIATTTCTLMLPVGWYFAVRQTAGTVTITSAFDQTVG